VADNARVAILMGSASDLPVMAHAAKQLERLGVEYSLEVTSAHRSPAQTVEHVRRLEGGGVKVFIVGAGMAAHLGGVVAAHTSKPVLGVPLKGSLLDGLDALLSTVQMPKGIPVATLAVGSHGAANAGILACQILALEDRELAGRLALDREEMAEGVRLSSEDARRRLAGLLEEIG
jgi:5-(carboxyamino)imidazole ribonucleotide mutase